MKEKEDLIIESSCSAGKTVEVHKKGYLYIDLEKAKEYYLKGGVHREIALNAGYEEAELNPVRNEWDSKIFGKKADGYYIFNSKIKRVEMPNTSPVKRGDMDIFKTEKQAKSALAYAQLTQLMALPEYNGDWVPDWNDDEFKYIIRRYRNGLDTDDYSKTHHHISFKTAEIRDKFLENNYDLLKEYFELD